MYYLVIKGACFMKAFDNAKYVKIQSEHILGRIQQFDNKLYLEFGGKMFDDFHASRVLPGFEPDSKIQVFRQIKDQTEFIIVANADDIQSNKIRNDIGITYESEVIRLINLFKEIGIQKGSVVISKYDNQPNANAFITRLKNLGHAVYKHYNIQNYPFNVDHVISDAGFGNNDYIITEKPLVVVTAPGPGSGKMATCLSQLYHEYKRGIKAGYAKYETFPIWNIPLYHPVNLAYEAATADLNDVNMIDPFHMEAYGKIAVNYNRDIEVFPVLKKMFEKIYGESPYQSPTDMGVNMAGYCIENDEEACKASKNEIVRRYYDAVVKIKLGKFKSSSADKISVIMEKLDISLSSRKCVDAAIKKMEKTNDDAFAIELADGRIITGKNSRLLRAPSAAIINALKSLANIDDRILVLSPQILDPIIKLKIEKLGAHNPRLHVDEVLTILAMSATTNPIAQMVLDQIENLKGTQAHSTCILSYSDEHTLKKLKINTTTEPREKK